MPHRDVAAPKDRMESLPIERLLAAVVESSDDAIISKSLDGVILSWNKAAERLFGYSAAQAVGRHISLIIPRERLTEEDQIIASLRAGERVEHFETERLRSNGQLVVVSLTISPIKDETGRVVGASKIARDVTRQRQAEARERELAQEAAAANLKFRAFFEQGALFAAIMDVKGVILETNRLSGEASGYTREQIVGRRLGDGPWWVSRALAEHIHAACARAAAGEPFRAELPYVTSAGIERVADVTVQPILDDAGHVVFLAATGSDITDRKRAEAERERFTTLVENIDDFVGICDLQGIPFFVNRAGLEMVGLESMDQARAAEIRDFFFPEDQARIVDAFLPEVLARGFGEIEVRFRNFKNGAARWMLYKVLTLLDADGKPYALATVSRDVTERRRLEDGLRDLAENLSEADRRKNEFLATLAHELRNPLATISNTVQLMRRRESAAGSAHPMSEMLERQMRQMARLVDDLLDVSRITRGKIELRKEPTALAPLLEQVADAARTLHADEQRTLTLSLPPDPIELDADSTRMAQVIGNILSNAYKFTDPGGRIALALEREGDLAVIRIRDTGIGIAPEHLPRLFGLFTQLDTSLERSRHGLGIGLALAKTLVELHGGSLEAQSAGIGSGSEFVIRLPIQPHASATPPAAAPSAGAEPAGRSILIVDDNQDSGDSLALLLELDGHRTHTARDGLEALDAAERLRPDAILLDIGLPKLNGYEVARRIRARAWAKDVLLVAMTGWGQDEDRQRSREAGFNVHIVKPVTHELLTQVLSLTP
jgi:PAS domain S-box-containing protein